MKRINLLLALLFLLAGSATAQNNKVLILGIDGCRPDALLAANTPELDTLAAHGAYSWEAEAGAISLDGPGWASILTGTGIPKHNVLSDGFLFPNFSTYPHFFKRVKDHNPALKTAAIMHWGPLNTAITTDADYKTAITNDTSIATQAGAMLLTNSPLNPDVLFLQFYGVDKAGHSFGFSPTKLQYLNAIETVDSLIGIVLTALYARPTYNSENWIIIAVTDHGGSGSDHGLPIAEDITCFYIVSGADATSGAITDPPQIYDVATTALHHLCIPIDPAWNLDGKVVGLECALPSSGFSSSVSDFDLSTTNTSDQTTCTDTFFNYWQFGDGNSSTDLEPAHTYANGNFNLCLYTTNNCGIDTLCDSVTIDAVGIKNELDSQNSLIIHQEPVSGDLLVRMREAKSNEGFRLIDLNGKLVFESESLPATGIRIPKASLPQGIYLYHLDYQTGITGKLMIR